MADQQPSRVIRFGLYEADLKTGELRKRGLRIRLPQQAFKVLEMLLERPGDVLTRAELQEQLWPDHTFVDFDHGLNKAVNKLRQVLGDPATNPRFVETIARRGYRFLAPLHSAVDTNLAREKIRLAVLPLENLNADATQDFFSDGLTEEMISQLGRLNPQRLGVIARTSVLPYKHGEKRIDQIGKELGVGYILEGSVRRVGDRVRITVQLIQVKDQTHLWATSYDRELADIFEVQHDVAQRIGRSLAFELLPEQPISRGSLKPEAHEAYLRARFFWNQRTENALREALHWYEVALEHDPDHALAYSGMADCYAFLSWFGALTPHQAGPKAKTAAQRAVGLGDQFGEGHASLALIRFWYDWEWAAAEQAFKRCLQLSPNYATARNWYSTYLSLMGRLEEAREQQRLAQEMDPLSLIIAMSASEPYYYARKYDRAIEVLQQVLKREPRLFSAHYNLAKAYVQKGMYGQATAAFEDAERLSGGREPAPLAAYAFARAGEIDRARKILAEIRTPGTDRYVAAPKIAMIHLGLGEIDQAFAQLEKGFEERSYWMIFLKMDPIYDSIRDDSRFQSLLRRLRMAA